MSVDQYVNLEQYVILSSLDDAEKCLGDCLQEGRVHDGLPGGCGALRGDLDLLLQRYSGLISDEALCGHGRRHSPLPERFVGKVLDGNLSSQLPFHIIWHHLFL